MDAWIQSWLQPLMVAGARLGSLMVFAPFFGSSAVPARVKAGLTLALAMLVAPLLPASSSPAGLGDWVRLMLGEAAIGLLLGLTLHFVFDAVQLAGHLVGFQAGLSLVNLIDPNTEVETTVFSIFNQVVTLLIFLQLNIHHWLVRGLVKSFQYLPPGSAGATGPAAEELARAAGGVFLLAVQIAAPVIIATLAADVALGLMGKASPQLPVLFVGFSVKALLGLAILGASLVVWPRLLEGWFWSALLSAERMLGLLR